MACVVLLASAPFAGGQDDEGAGDPQTIEFDGSHAEGRFVAFDVDAEAGAVCDWSFEGKTIIEAMTGVSGQARAEGRVVMMDGGSAASDGACEVAADAEVGANGSDEATSSTSMAPAPTDGQEEMDDQDGLDEEDNDASTNGTSTGNGTSTTTTTSPASSTRIAAATVKLHDNPRGAIAIDLDAGQTVHLDLAGELAVRADGDKVRIDGDGFSASLFLARGSNDVEVRVQGSTILLDAQAPAKVHFRVGDNGLEEDEREAVDEHVDDGDVACEVFVSDDDQPDVVVIDGANVSVRSTHTAVRVDLSIDIDVDVSIGGSDGDTSSETTTTSDQTATSASPTDGPTATGTQTAPPAGGDGDDQGDDGADEGDGGSDCGCAAKVVILDVDVTVLVLEADDDLLVRLGGTVLARADSVEDALTVEVGEDPEALVVVDQENEVKVITSLPTGSSTLTLEAQGGEEFTTREPVRVTRTTTLEDAGDDDGVERSEDGGAADDGAGDGGGGAAGAPGFGLGVALAAVAVVTLLAARRRLD